jgi:hypothetical protein
MNSKKEPLKKIRVGRFQISTWKFERLVNPVDPDKEPVAYLEKWIDVDRACIQYGTYNKIRREWENQKIWCSPTEFQQLTEVLEQL